jgi:hypothetical protein
VDASHGRLLAKAVAQTEFLELGWLSVLDSLDAADREKMHRNDHAGVQ